MENERRREVGLRTNDDAQGAFRLQAAVAGTPEGTQQEHSSGGGDVKHRTADLDDSRAASTDDCERAVGVAILAAAGRRVVHCKRASYDVFIGRPSDWGNPFVIGRDGTRKQVIELYREWIQQQSELMARLPELRGKTLGCYCAPKACHGDVLLELAEYDIFRSNLLE